LQSYLKHIGPQLAQAGHLTPMLGIWQKLNSAKVTESNAFELLSALTKYVPQSDMNVLLKTVFLVVLTRLRSTKSNLYPIRAVQYFALFCGLYGGQSFAGYLNEIQPNLHLQIAGMVWAPKALGASSSRILAKSQVIGLSKYIFDAPLLNDDPGKQVFGQCVLAIVSILLSSSFSREEKDISDEGAMVYDATFSSLKYATKVPEDPFPSIADPASTFVIGLKTISEQYPGVVTPLLRPLAEDEKIATGFQSLLQSHQVNLA
jgi:CAS/CSE protein, C-terminus